MSNAPRPSAPRPNARPTDVPEQPSQDVSLPPAAGAHSAPEEARRPDDYLETPGSHRRPDGAATDVGA